MSKSQLERVRRLCAALPETSERLSHGEPTFFVRGKVYVMFANNHHGDGRVAIWLPVPPGFQEGLLDTAPTTFFRPPYVGGRGWVGIVLDAIGDRDLQLYIETAWELIAPRRLRTARSAANIVVQVTPPLDNPALNVLFAAAWPGHTERDWAPVLSRSLTYIGAFSHEALVGFVNVAWDGGIHAFLLDTTVHPALQRRGIGARLVRAAASAAQERGMEWLHVDYEPHLEGFYRACGFVETRAGLLRLKEYPVHHRGTEAQRRA